MDPLQPREADFNLVCAVPFTVQSTARVASQWAVHWPVNFDSCPRRQITPTSKFSPHVWFTQKRHLLAKAAILLERSRPLASRYRPPTCPGLARRRPFETKLSHSPVNGARLVYGLRVRCWSVQIFRYDPAPGAS